MEIVFATHSNGYGTHVVVNMELIDSNSVVGYEEIMSGIGLLFNRSIESIYKDGGVYINKAIIDNINTIKPRINSPKVLYIANAVADRVDYQPIAFYGATIKWLNEYWGLDIPIPKYVYDRANRAFYIPSHNIS